MVRIRDAITVIQPEPNNLKESQFPQATAGWLGIAQIVIGSLCFIFHIVSLSIDAGADRAGHGMWGGAAFIITGIIALCAAYKPNQYLIATLLTVSILSIILSILMFIFAAVGLSGDQGWGDCDHFGICRESVSPSTWRSRLAMNSLLLILAMIEAVTAFWSALICGQVQIILASTPQNISDVPHQNTQYNHYTEAPVGVAGPPQPRPPQRSNSSRDVSRQLAVSHGYSGSQGQRNPGFQDLSPGTPDYNSNRRAPLPLAAAPLAESSTLPRSGYMYDNAAADLQSDQGYRGSHNYREPNTSTM